MIIYVRKELSPPTDTPAAHPWQCTRPHSRGIRVSLSSQAPLDRCWKSMCPYSLESSSSPSTSLPTSPLSREGCLYRARGVLAFSQKADTCRGDIIPLSAFIKQSRIVIVCGSGDSALPARSANGSKLLPPICPTCCINPDTRPTSE